MPTTPEVHLSVVTAIDQIGRGFAGDAITTLVALREALESDGTHLDDVTTAPARAGDPETSKAAAKTVTPTNHLGLLLRTFAEYDRAGGLAAYEACEAAGIAGSSSPWTRVGELKRASIIEVIGTKVNPGTGRTVEVYALSVFGRLEAGRIMGGDGS